MLIYWMKNSKLIYLFQILFFWLFVLFLKILFSNSCRSVHLCRDSSTSLNVHRPEFSLLATGLQLQLNIHLSFIEYVVSLVRFFPNAWIWSRVYVICHIIYKVWSCILHKKYCTSSDEDKQNLYMITDSSNGWDETTYNI